jgi:segregation and condensation protein B
MVQTNLDNIIIALLFASDEPLSLRKVSAVLDDVPIEDIREAIERVAVRFGDEDSVIRLEQVAGGYQFSTSSAYSNYIARLYRGRRKQRLSKASMETLAIIVYKQPVTRADIENLRGVGCGGVITTLMERTLIRIVGKAKVLGSPFLYGTTQEFLEYLGLNRLDDLPSMEDLEALLEQEAAGEHGFELGEVAVPFAAEPETDPLTHETVEDVGRDESQQVPIEESENPSPVGSAKGDIDPEVKSAETYQIDDRENK